METDQGNELSEAVLGLRRPPLQDVRQGVLQVLPVPVQLLCAISTLVSSEDRMISAEKQRSRDFQYLLFVSALRAIARTCFLLHQKTQVKVMHKARPDSN